MYAGSTDGSSILNLFMAGWVLCDGSTYPNGQFPDLFNAISESYGGFAGYFAVPTYRGLFIRGVDGTAGRDPDSAVRIAPRPDLSNSGNTGNNVGSLQMDQIGSHTHAYNYYNNYLKSSHTLGHECLSGQASSGMQFVGDVETRPINQYVNFIIKAVASPDAVPLGMVIPFAGDFAKSGSILRAAGWLPCTGDKQQVGNFQSLYQVISNYYGADDQNSFRLPDFRGQFLRGVQGQLRPGQSKPMDPDYLNRTAPQPALPQPGNSGNQVGSLEGGLFASHNHNYTYNNDYWSCAATAIGPHAETNSGVTWTSAPNSALTETRPANINANFIIKAQ
jgi:microcystin-dependent protein